MQALLQGALVLYLHLTWEHYKSRQLIQVKADPLNSRMCPGQAALPLVVVPPPCPPQSPCWLVGAG
jgi:hypothetical protein